MQGIKVPRYLGSHGVSLQGCFLTLHKSDLGQSGAGYYFSGIIGKCLRPRFSSCLCLTGRHQFCSTIKRLNPPSPPVQPRTSPVSRYLLPQFAPRPAIDRPPDQPRRLANAHDGVPETRSEPFQGPHQEGIPFGSPATKLRYSRFRAHQDPDHHSQEWPDGRHPTLTIRPDLHCRHVDRRRLASRDGRDKRHGALPRALGLQGTQLPAKTDRWIVG